jgi:predicted small secreted protein
MKATAVMLAVLLYALLLAGCAVKTIQRDGQPVTVVCEPGWHGFYLIGPEFSCERAH